MEKNAPPVSSILRWPTTVTAKSFSSQQNHFYHGKIIFVTAKSFWPRQNHFRHGKIIFNRGKIIYNQGKYILCARDLYSSYKMGLEGLRDSHFMSLYAAPYLGLLTNFASCVFVVGLVWRIFKWSIEPLQLRRRIFKTLISRKILIGKWHLIQNQPHVKKVFKEPPMISYRKGKSLQDLQVRAKL